MSAVAFGQYGTLLASASEEGTIRLWNPTTGRMASDPLVDHTGSVHGVAFAPDSHLLATAGHDGSVRLWEAATGQPANVGPLR